ncbi:hypothetical protein ABPG77_007169 [Micractinium sp. CCAP 211/92]
MWAQHRQLAPPGRTFRVLVLILALLQPGATGNGEALDGDASLTAPDLLESLPPLPPAVSPAPLLRVQAWPAEGSELQDGQLPVQAAQQQTVGAAFASPRVASLLPPGQGLMLVPDYFDDDAAACTDAEVLRASFPAFSLPTGGQQLALLFHLSALDCAENSVGALLGLGAASLSVACTAEGQAAELVLTATDTDASTRLALPPNSTDGNGGLALLLSLDQQTGSLAVCANGQLLVPVGGSAAAGSSELLQSLGGLSPVELVGAAVVLGARSGSEPAARARVDAAYVADAAFPCSSTGPGEAQAALLRLLADAAAASSGTMPQLAVEQQPGGDATVGQEVLLTATAAPASADDTARLRLTLFGLPPPGCRATECGDLAVESAADTAAGQPARLTVTAAYPRAGRYIARLEATVGRGWVATLDHPLIVRKAGDPGSSSPAEAAPCCRVSPEVVAMQEGRPISDAEYRSGTAQRQATGQLGWSDDYWQHEDREAERLFDYSSLAPPIVDPPLNILTCAATRLAGAGSALLFGASDELASHSHGHNKRLALLPAGFSWVTRANQIDCQEHWTGWQEASPQRLPNGRGGTCSAACTQAGTLQLLRETGMFEQYNQALIAASYGQLSLSADVAVLPEVYIPFNYTSPSNSTFAYYEDLPLQALEAAGEDPWMWFILAPLALHQVPPFRAWSGGRSAGGAVVTQCYPTMYYAVHETGHRLGFRHANMYRLQPGSASAPVDPLGPGETTTDGYSDRTDVMACCRGDYGLYYRLMAGWIGQGSRGQERVVLGAAELATPAQRRFTLWPFDRPESRGNLLALTIRRSADEVLVIGFRSAPHWQDLGIAGGNVAPADSRHNVRGLSVELVRRDPETGQWEDHRGLLDFNMLTGDWPDSLPATAGDFPRDSSFALLKEGTAWHHAASGLLLAFEAVGGCEGSPGLALHNHSAMSFVGFGGEWPGQELPAGKQADFTGFQGLECAQLVLTTQAPPPQGRLDFSIEPGLTSEAAPVAAQRRRSLRMQPGDGSGGQLAAGDGAAAAASCGVPAAPTLRLRLPAGQQLSSVVWRDALNRTVAVQSGASLAAAAAAAGAASSAATWTTPAVTLPALYPFAESSHDPAAGCDAGLASCQLAQRRYSVRLLAPDGRHSVAAISAAPPTLAGTQLSIQVKHYEPQQLTQERRSLSLPLGWPSADSAAAASAPGVTFPAGVVLYNASGGAELALKDSQDAVVTGSSLPASGCSQQWTLSLQLSLTSTALAAAAAQQQGQVLLSVDGGLPSLSLGPSLLPGTPASPALWLRWGGAAPRRVVLPHPLAGLQGSQTGTLRLVLVRDGSRLGLWANQQGGWVVRDLACIPTRLSITYCNHTPNPAGPPPFRPPASIALGAAAAGAAGAPRQAADAGLAWARYYSYALPEGDLAAEGAAGEQQLRSYFRVQPAEGGSGDGSAGLRTVLVAPPKSVSKGSGGGGSAPALPIPLLAAAAGGGAAAAAAAAALCCCWRRRRQRRRQEEVERARALAGLTAESGSSVKSADVSKGPPEYTAVSAL